MRRALRALAALGLALVSACASACGGAASREGRTTIDGAPLGDEALDDAARLATLLPTNAERCSVARPALIADRRRPLILRASQGDVLAWSRDLRIVAYASARRTGERGRQEIVTLLRLSQPASDRAALEDALPLHVRWEARCRADTCDLPRAELLDPRTLRIVRGDVDLEREAVGGSPCVDLAVAWPSAIELDASTQRCEDPQAERCFQRRVLEPTADGVRQRVEDALGSERAALHALDALRLLPELEGGIDIDRRGATVVTIRRISWAELEVLLEDDRIARAAYARREQDRRARPLEEIDVERLPFVRAQVRLREERLERLHGEGRRRAAEELATLMARAIERHPDALDLARRLARLQLDELDDAVGAVDTVERAIATGLARDEAWRMLRREALVAEVGAAGLAGVSLTARDVAARALREDGVVGSFEDAQRAVDDLASGRQRGMSYELAESTWAHARAVTARRVALRPVTGGAPLVSLPATLAMLAELGGDEGPLSVFVVARGAPSEGAAPSATGDGSVQVLRLFPTDRSVRLRCMRAGSAASFDASLQLGAAIESELAPGPVTIDVSLTSLSSPSVARTLRIEGELAGGRVRIDRADAWTARHDWLAVERYLAEPLREMGARVFPAPDLVLRAASEEEAVRLAGAGDDPPQARCAAAGREIRCVPRPDSDARGSLRRIVRAALGAAPPPPAE